MQAYWNKVITDSQLISLPEVYLKLQKIISTDDYSMADVTEVIGLDPAVTARLLRMVNSSFFGLAAEIETVSRAVNYLGTQQVHDLVLSTSVASTFSDIEAPNFNINRFWQNSVYCAICARELAVLCNVLDSERLFVSGLLHDIGHLLMFQSIPELAKEAADIAEQSQKPIQQVEHKLIGFDYALVGAAMLRYWNLPSSLCDSIHYQLTPSNTDKFHLEASILHIAGLMTHCFDQNIAVDQGLLNADSGAINTTNIQLDQCLAVDRMSRESLVSVLDLLFPQQHKKAS